MTSHSPDRLWASTRQSTLTDAERERAREAIEQTPAILESLYAAALGQSERTLADMTDLLERVRR